MDRISFTVNGERYTISGAEVDLKTTLITYLRNHLQLYGTKAMCHEGGCGACVVSVTKTHPVTKEKHVFSVNSCLVHILSCHDWDITTVEGIGNRKDGYHPIQVNLAAFNGSQCGYCTPGLVMSMYSLQQSNKKLTMKQVENSFGGNICRCTGYRPVLDTFKTFATDVEFSLQNKLQDLEDLHLAKCVKKCERKCSIDESWCLIDHKTECLKEIATSGGQWFRANTLQDVFQILSKERNNSYKLVSGNTAKGVFPETTEAQVLIDISSIESLKSAYTDQNFVLGAGMTLTDVMAHFKAMGDGNGDFRYLDVMYNHLDLVAHLPIRNIGTLGGNLALKHQHHEFPSDIFLLLDTVGATVTIVNNEMHCTEFNMQDFLHANIKDKIITEVKLPPLYNKYHLRTYKIMVRAQNAHSIVNAGFLFKLDDAEKVTSVNICIGNISPSFHRALSTERVLVGQTLDNKGLQSGLRELSKELVPQDYRGEPSGSSRKMIALGLFYKAMLSLATNVSPRFKSGGTMLTRGVSQGTQTYETDKTLWPLNKPVPNVDGIALCSGEAKYACDIPSGPRGVHVAFILSKVCRAELLGFDTSEALKLPGVITFLCAKDIPGENNYTPNDVPLMNNIEEIFASSTIRYYGQPLGVIIATNRDLAITAAGLVHAKVKVMNVKPVLTIRDALQAPDKEKRLKEDIKIDAKSKGTDIRHVFSGSFTVPAQYHYTLEPQSCHVDINNGTIVVRSASQWMDLIQVAVAKALDVDENRILVEVPRIGGSYGAKITPPTLIACACALVAYKLNRPASLVMPVTDNMTAIGKRPQCDFDYECAVNDEGVIQYLNTTYYSNSGSSLTDKPSTDLRYVLTNLYFNDRFNIIGYNVITDKPSETWFRGPGSTEATAYKEHIMQRIAHITGKDHIDVRIANLQSDHDNIKDLIMSFKTDTAFEDRKVAAIKFNNENAWKKKSVNLSLMSYTAWYFGNFPVTISVYHGDGTVAISHGGVEMGQGINTKIAQVCAYSLKIPLEKVTVRGSDSFISPNAMASNSSITSESVAFSTIKACEKLMKSLQPIKEKLNEPTWEELIQKAFEDGINLQTTYNTYSNEEIVGYNIYGICAAEVELDVLTGNHIVRRVDILEDTGVSLSPEIDVGQVEGAFVTGLGLWTSEELKYDKTNGELLTNRTWTYKPPGAKDIPEDFRVKFMPNSSNPAGVLRSKTTGEPSLTLAVAVTHALHNAILEARKEFGYIDKDWVFVDSPYSVENIMKAISPKTESFLLTK